MRNVKRPFLDYEGRLAQATVGSPTAYFSGSETDLLKCF